MINRNKFWLLSGALLLSGSLLFISCRSNKNLAPLRTVEEVDLKRYVGTWYEIARLPARFQKGCVGTQAIYEINEDGTIGIYNRCRIDSLDGKVKDVKGKAWIVDKKTNSKLKVQFFWPFKGDYWIIDLDKEYHYVLVGEPSRKYLWILSRTKTLDPSTTERLLSTAQQQGFNTNNLIWTKQL